MSHPKIHVSVEPRGGIGTGIGGKRHGHCYWEASTTLTFAS